MIVIDGKRHCFIYIFLFRGFKVLNERGEEHTPRINYHLGGGGEGEGWGGDRTDR